MSSDVLTGTGTGLLKLTSPVAIRNFVTAREKSRSLQTTKILTEEKKHFGFRSILEGFFTYFLLSYMVKLYDLRNFDDF